MNNKAIDLLKSIHIDVKIVYRILIVMLSATLLLYARWAVMGGSKPEFKPTDNPAAFSDNLFTKVRHTFSVYIDCYHNFYS